MNNFNHTIICPSCNSVNAINEFICQNCLQPIDNKQELFKIEQNHSKEISQIPIDITQEDHDFEVDPDRTIIPQPKIFQLTFLNQRLFVTESFILGRDAEISKYAKLFGDSSKISRSHAEIIYTKDKNIAIRDLGSANGTFVNDTPLKSNEIIILNHGDTIRLAKDFTFKVIEN